MADVTAYMGVDPALADIRREGSQERGEIRYDIATKTGDVRREVAEGVSNVRREQAVGFDETRYAVAGSGSDIRREQAIGFGETKFAIAEHSEDTNRDVLNSGFATRTKVDEVGDAILQRNADYFIASQARDFDTSRDISALRATTDMATQKLGVDILLAGERSASAAALAGEKTAAAAALESAKIAAAIAVESSRLGSAVALGQSQISKEVAESKYDLSKQVAYENEKTRDLINDLKNSDLNRHLIERNSDINYYRNDCNRWEGLYGNNQFAQLSSQVNALQSNLAETRQGLYNFGTMAGVGQSSNQNQVR